MVQFDDDEPVHLRYRSNGDYLYDPLTGKPVMLEGDEPHEIVQGDERPAPALGPIGRLRRSLQRLWRPLN